jgi:N-acetylmuramoyl-L-alanine amidase
MQPHRFALVVRPRVHMKAFAIAVLAASLGGVAVQAQDSALPQPSDAIANKITTLLRSITGASEPAKAPKYQRTRFVIELDRAAPFDVFSLVNPNRVVLQLPTMAMRLPSIPDKLPGSLVTAVRSGQSGTKDTRIVIQVAAPVVVENAHVLPPADGRPAQLHLDIVPMELRKSFASAGKPLAAAPSSGLGGVGLQPPVPRKADTLKQRDKRTQKFKIVVDPGHGGHDSGAKKHGIMEKNVVLAFGRMLREKLEATGRYEVMMTRSDDRFISLTGRREFAERHKADLFISVHADYARSNASGATIYSLREKVAERLKKTAKEQVGDEELLSKDDLKVLKSPLVRADAGALRTILTDLAWRDVESTRHQTGTFSETVIKHMGQSTEMRSQPHRTAAFRVLKTATMPAVLIELAYVSNRNDARRLSSETWRDKVSDSIVTAVNNYFGDALNRLPM